MPDLGVTNQQFFETVTVDGVPLKSLRPKYVGHMKSQLIGWRSEQAQARPVDRIQGFAYKQKSARDIGDLMRWADIRADWYGYGIIIVPPRSYYAGADLMNWARWDPRRAEDRLVGYATTDPRVAAQYAGPGKPGFVAIQPKVGWGNRPKPLRPGIPSSPPPIVPGQHTTAGQHIHPGDFIDPSKLADKLPTQQGIVGWWGQRSGLEKLVLGAGGVWLVWRIVS